MLLIVVIIVIIAQAARAVASLLHGSVGWLDSRGWQGQIQCYGKVDLSNKHKDDHDDVSSPHQVNDWMLGRPGNVGRRCVLESPQ